MSSLQNLLEKQKLEFQEKLLTKMWHEDSCPAHSKQMKSEDECDCIYSFVREEILSQLSTIQSQIVSAVKEKVEGMERGIVPNKEGEITYTHHTTVQGYNQALSDLSSWLEGEKK